MTQKLRAPTVEPRQLSIVAPINKGGTGATNPVDVAQSMGAVSRYTIGKDYGVAPYPLSLAALPDATAPTTTIDGPDTVSVNSVVLFTITNYDTRTTYTVSVSVGTVSTVDGVITYTAPSTPQAVVMTVNGRPVTFDVTLVTPLAPTIASPVDNASDIALSVLIASSALALPSGTPNHLSSDWQLATDADFVNIVAGVFNDTVNKTTWNVPGLTIDTVYFVRVRYKDAVYGYSLWSNTNTFTTRHNLLTGNEEAKLATSDGAANDLVGYCVSMTADGSRVVVTAAGKAAGSATTEGAAYIFLRTGTAWTQEKKLLASDAAKGDQFGCSATISADGTRVIIGALTETPSATTARGAAYIFLRSGVTWAQEAKIVPTDPTNSSYFGVAVDISSDGSRVAVGAYYKTGSTTAQGAAYIFLRTGATWKQEVKLLASDPNVGDYFGWAVSLTADGTRVAIGAYNKSGSLGATQGAVYVFLRSGVTWTEEDKITASDSTYPDAFGFSVSMSADGTRLAVGAPLRTGGQGAVYVYSRTGTVWGDEQKINAFDFASGDNMGSSVMLNGDGSRLAIGAPSKRVTQTGQGVVYIFSRWVNNWTQENKLVASDAAASDAFGCSVSISNDGTRVAIGAYQKTGTAGAKVGACYIDS